MFTSLSQFYEVNPKYFWQRWIVKKKKKVREVKNQQRIENFINSLHFPWFFIFFPYFFVVDFKKCCSIQNFSCAFTFFFLFLLFYIFLLVSLAYTIHNNLISATSINHSKRLFRERSVFIFLSMFCTFHNLWTLLLFFSRSLYFLPSIKIIYVVIYYPQFSDFKFFFLLLFLNFLLW